MSQTPTSHEAHSATATLASRLKALQRTQRRVWAGVQLGRWLLGCAILFFVFIVPASFFELSQLAAQALGLCWLLGVFALSSYCVWSYLKHFSSAAQMAHRVEAALPELEQRVITSLEFANKPDAAVSPQLLDQLWQDTEQRVEQSPLQQTVAKGSARLQLLMGGVFGAAMVLALMNVVSVREGAQRLLAAWEATEETLDQPITAALPVSLRVEPGDVSMQRGDDLQLVALLDNATSAGLVVYIQSDNLNWEQVDMPPDNDSGEADKVFALTLNQVTQDFSYYVEYTGSGREPVRSAQYTVNLFDLPRVEGLSAAYEFPVYTEMESRVDDPGGDIVAPQGTQVTLTAALNKSVTQAKVVFTSGKELDLTLNDRSASVSFEIVENDNYLLRLVDAGGFENRDPIEYYIRAIEDELPEVSVRVPGRDRDVTALEEIVIEVEATDDYGLKEVLLEYSVIRTEGNGEVKTVDFTEKGRKKITESTLVYLEDLRLQPGDVLSYSVAATDNNGYAGASEVSSDIYFLEVVPTDREYSHAPGGSGGGGGGGGGNDGNALITNQKDVISATWKLSNRRDKVAPENFAEDAAIIRESQEEVAQRAQMSINRLTERGRFEDDRLQTAVRALQQGIADMEVSMEHLDNLDLKQALRTQQKSLQSLLKADAQINRTQVSSRQSNGAGGGSGGGEQQDLNELFQMELGELENRYELPKQQAGGQQAQRNETLDKLKELARRQERLSRAQRELARRENQLDEEQKRRQLERLQREQEELRQQLSQLSQNMQQQSQQQSQQSQSSSQSSSSASSSSSQQSQQQQAQQQAQQQLQRALEQMQQAANSESASQAAARSQKALDTLRQQTEAMSQAGEQSVAELEQAVKEQAQQLLEQQRRLRRDMESFNREQGLGQSRREARQAETSALQQAQNAQRDGLEALTKSLRELTSQAGDEQRALMESAHTLTQELRPIKEKMDTSRQILQNGMVNLSLKLESDVESALADVQQQIQGLGAAPGQNNEAPDNQQLASQLRALRQAVQQLQEQVQAQSGDGEQRGQGQNEQPTAQPDQLAVRRGERSAGDRPSRRDMQETLQRSREIAREIVQLGQQQSQQQRGGTADGGAASWTGSARSVATQLTEQSLQEFLNQPALLAQLLAPIAELEEEFRVQAELGELSDKAYSDLAEDVPEKYRALVESYYRQLSESKSQ